MTTIRQELEARVAAFAAAQTPPLPVAYENVPFTKPTTSFLEVVFTASNTINPTVDANRTRVRGMLQVNVWSPSGKGAGPGEAIANALAAMFPVVPKTGTVSIEQTPDASQNSMDIAGWMITPVKIMYRKEGKVV